MLKSLFKHYINSLPTIVVKTTLVILFLNSEQFRRWTGFSRIIHNISEERRHISDVSEWHTGYILVSRVFRTEIQNHWHVRECCKIFTFYSLIQMEVGPPKFEQCSLFKSQSEYASLLNSTA